MSPVPEPAVEAGARGIAEDHEYLPGKKLILSDYARAEACLRRALNTGTLIAVPEDEAGHRELVERAEAALLWARFQPDVPEGERTRFEARTVLQALGLLPEQERA